jgi:sulfane dehydrogenase subunit SoxC
VDLRKRPISPGGRKEDPMNSEQSGRRQFLKKGATLAGLAAGAIVPASAATPAPESVDQLHAYGQRSRFENWTRKGKHLWPPSGNVEGAPRDYGFRNPIQYQLSMITPAPLHFTISHGNEPPDIDPTQHRLLIHGLVDRPLVFSLDDLKRLPSVSRFHFVECNANSGPTGPTGAARRAPTATPQETHGLTSCSLWTGVPLSLLLKQAGVQKSATWVLVEGADPPKHLKSIPIEKAFDDCLVVYGQNGEAVRPEQGYPLRLLVPGWEGINNVKWLRRVKLVDQPYMDMRESTKYPSLRPDGKARWFQFELGPKSVITRPSGGQHLSGPGFYEISGLAWSGGGAIRRVEISVDGGKTWKDAQLQDPVAPKAHTRFVSPWEWNGEEVTILSRSTDERDEVQPTRDEIAKIWHIDMNYYQTSTNLVGHFNAIQPWKIDRDGSVLNALFL